MGFRWDILIDTTGIVFSMTIAAFLQSPIKALRKDLK